MTALIMSHIAFPFLQAFVWLLDHLVVVVKFKHKVLVALCACV